MYDKCKSIKLTTITRLRIGLQVTESLITSDDEEKKCSSDERQLPLQSDEEEIMDVFAGIDKACADVGGGRAVSKPTPKQSRSFLSAHKRVGNIVRYIVGMAFAQCPLQVKIVQAMAIG